MPLTDQQKKDFLQRLSGTGEVVSGGTDYATQNQDLINKIKSKKKKKNSREKKKEEKKTTKEEATKELESRGVKDSFIDRTKDALKKRASEVGDILQKRGTEIQEADRNNDPLAKIKAGITGTAEVLGRGASAVQDVLSEGATSAFRMLPDQQELKARDAWREDFENDKVAQYGVEKLAEASDKAKELEEQYPIIGAGVRVGGTYLDLLGAGSVGKEVVDQSINATRRVVGTGQDIASKAPAMIKRAQQGVDNAITATKKGANSTVSVIRDTTKKVPPVIQRGVNNIKTNKLAKIEADKAINKLNNPVARKAVEQGVDIRDVGTITNAKPKVVEKGGEILKLAEQKSLGSKVAEPKTVVGKAFRDRIQAVDKARKKAGQQLSEYAKSIPDEKIANVRTNILNRIKEVGGLDGVKMKLVNGKHQLDFSNTLLEGDKSAIKEIIDYFNTASTKKAQGMHLYRQKLFEDLGLKNSTRVKQVETTADKAVNAIRQGLADTLDSANNQYKVLNKQYAVLENAMKNVRSKLKSVSGADDEILDLKLAQLSRRLTSNADADMKALLDEIEQVAKSVGFDDGLDVVELQEILNVIEKYFDISSSTGFSKQITKGVGDIPKGKTELAVKALKAIGEKTFNPTTTDAVKKKLIKDLFENLLSGQVPSLIQKAIK